MTTPMVATEHTPPGKTPAKESARPAVLMFPGLGDHYVNMGRDLYRSEPAFREQIDLSAELLKPELGVDLRSVLYPGPDPSPAASPDGEAPGAPKQGVDLRRMLGRSRKEPSEVESQLNQTRLAQPALFVVEYALARLWQSVGLRVGAMIGYSLGEYVAACLAGVLSLEDSLTLVARRAQMIEELPPGAMLAVPLPEERVAPLLGEHLSVSAINSPEFCVVSGPREAVDDLEKRLLQGGTPTRRVQSSHAFHSRMMEPIAGRVTRLVEGYSLRAPQVPYVSNVSGALITAAQATDPAYWAEHLCRPVRFADGLRALLQRPGRIFVEAGPGQTLSSLAITTPKGDVEGELVVVPSMRHAYDVQADTAVLLNAVGRLRLAGAALDADRHSPSAGHAPPGAGEATPAKAEREAANAPPGDAAFAPRTDVEKELAAIWQKLLSAERVGRADNFFALGGNSLVATRLLFRIFKSFRVNVPLRRVYEAPSLAAMAAAIEAAIGSKDGAALGGDAAVPAPAAAGEQAHGSLAPRRYRLPNGLEIIHQSEAETRHFYEDIFAHRSYVKHGIQLPRGATVFDVGGNIGLFTLFVHTEARDARIYTFEPAPPLFEILRQNVAAHQVQAELFNVGLSDRERDAPFTFYPNSSGMSSFHADEADEKHVLRTIIENQGRIGMAGMDQVLPHSEELLGVRLKAQTFTARLRRLSDVLRETGVTRIDLMKVDVQKAELAVLEGIDEGDWPKIAQIVLEVHDVEGRVRHITTLLERRGFTVIAEQDALYVGTNIHNVYAVRETPASEGIER
uniref:Polyketide synthase n=1 Tax=Sorangium cellulosum TaxID=56 RepID=I0J6Y9_SORCE|nr:polyketide synthase [Sorangium cellulosum]